MNISYSNTEYNYQTCRYITKLGYTNIRRPYTSPTLPLVHVHAFVANDLFSFFLSPKSKSLVPMPYTPVNVDKVAGFENQRASVDG